MAHKVGGGSTKNNRDSNSKNLGLKKFKNELIKKGSFLIKQYGLKNNSDTYYNCGKEYTLYALKDGIVNSGN